MKTRATVTRLLCTLSVAGLTAASGIIAADPLPSGTLPIASQNFVTSGQAAAARAGNTLTINQASQKAVLNWQSFNIARDSTVNFVQPGRTAQALNRIGDQSASVIQGALNANGRVYLINRNGILFDQGSQVNTGGLVASSLDVSDELFDKGVLTAAAQAAPAFTGATGFVRVAEGAEIRTASGGQVWLFAPEVENSGVISTPDGQTLLAAGREVYLSASNEAAMRGVTVEVASGGATVNLGEIVAERGNATLAGLAVNQSGRVSATTTVSRNGSIWLQGSERGDLQGHAGRPGRVTFAAGSRTEITPDTASTETSTDAQVFLHSEVKASAQRIELQGDARIVAPAGDVTLATAVNSTDPESGRIYVGSGARIDVSGLDDVALPTSRNLIEVELRGNELADAPLQKLGFLRGKRVTVDIREGTPLADLSAAVAAVPRTVAERSTHGGTITLDSVGDVVTRAGSVLDVSGGSIRYDGGWLSSTQLVTADGRLVGIEQARPDRVYVGTVGDTTVSSGKWGAVGSRTAKPRRYEQGYVDGEDAGSIRVSSAAAVLDGTMQGRATAGVRQRTLADTPKGGELLVTTLSETPGYESRTEIRQSVTALAGDFDADTALPSERAVTLALDATALQAGGFSRLGISSAGDIELTEGTVLDLGPGGALTLRQFRSPELTFRGNIRLNGDVLAAGGTVSVSATGHDDTGSIVVGGLIDVAGIWRNDNPLLGVAAGPIVTDGGRVTLSADAGVELLAGSVIDASGGAWLNSARTLTGGRGGSIVLRASKGKGEPGNTEGGEGPLRLGGELRGYGLTQGGSLSIAADGIYLGSTPASSPTDTIMSLDFFSQGGFGGMAAQAWERSGALSETLAPVVRNWILPAGFDRLASADRLGAIASIGVLPDDQRQGIRLTLPLASLTEQGRIVVDPGSSLTVEGAGHLFIDGQIRAAGGDVTLAVRGQTPASNSLEDFDTSQALWLGSNADIDVSGAAVVGVDRSGNRVGHVLDGGSVSLAAKNAFIVTEAGSRIDVSGTRAALDVATATSGGGQLLSREVASHAGSVRASSDAGLYLAGELRGAGGSESTRGGTLSLNLQTDTSGFLAGRRSLGIQSGALTLPAVEFGTDLGLGAVGRGAWSVDTLAGSGFEALALRSWDELRFSGNTSISVGRSVTLDAAVLAAAPGAQVAVSAPYLAIGNADVLHQSVAEQVTSGDALFEGDARTIDLVGHMLTQGLGTVRLNATSDIRAHGVLDADATAVSSLGGSLTTAGSVLMRAGQLYPTTLSEYAIVLRDNPEARFELTGTGARPTAPLSAGGKLSITAPNISIAGVVRAPFGSLELDATDEVRIAAGSLLSVSGAGITVPFGYTENQLGWFYALDAAVGSANRIAITRPPQKELTISGGRVELEEGALLDLAGGGDLQAWEWLKGPGGSRDVLAKPGMFAILPSLGDAAAPRDWQNEQGSLLQEGDAISLTGIAGLPSGAYTLLPAHYALLPGAYAISVAPGTTDLLPRQSQVRADGSYLVSGRQGVAGTPKRDDRTSGFLLYPGSYVRSATEFILSGANQFFGSAGPAAAAVLPQDAGHLRLASSESLLAHAAIDVGATRGARGDIDIVAPRIEVVSDGATSLGGLVQLDADDLSIWNPRSLLLGGVRSLPDPEGAQTLTVGASEVAINNDAAHTLRVTELIAAATESVEVGAGANVVSIGAVAASTAPAVPRDLNLAGAGALLMVSSTKDTRIERSGVTQPATSGQLTIGENARLMAGGLLQLDASREASMAETASIDAKALAISSSRIDLGTPQDAGAGLTLSQEFLTRLGAATDELRLVAYERMALWGDIALGNFGGAVQAPSLVLDTPTLQSMGGDASIRARSLTVRNSVADSAGTASAGSGTLVLASDGDLRIEAGSIALAGLATTRLEAAGDLRFGGEGSLSFSGDAVLSAARITSDAGADRAVHAGGALTLAREGASNPTSVSPGLGARLSLSGTSLVTTALIDLPAGQLALTAREGSLTLAESSQTRVAGVNRRFFDVSRAAPAGGVTLAALAGDVSIASGARIDASGAPGGNAGGSIAVRARGRLQLGDDAVLLGNASGAAQGGQFSLDAGTVDALDVLGNVLDVGGFSGGRSVRARNGDIAIGAADSWRANRIHLSADTGRIDVVGSLLAQGPQAGRIEVWAGQGLDVRSGAVLRAVGRGDDGGTVMLGNGSDIEWLNIGAGSTIDVGSTNGGAQGVVALRVPRIGFSAEASGGMDVASGPVLGTIVGTSHVSVEGFQVYGGVSTLGSGLDFATLDNDVAAFMSHSGAIEQRLAGGSTALRVTPGIEIRSDAQLTLASDWSLYQAQRPNDVAGVLTLRASDDLLLNGTLSDGFADVATDAALMSGPSWSYRLIGGADAAAADPRAVTAAAGGIRLAEGKLVRTGVGSIALSAGSDIAFANGSTSAIYTAGAPAAALDGFTLPSTTAADAPVYAENGGDVSVSALGNLLVLASPTRQAVNPWQFRAGTGRGTTTWWAAHKNFGQNVGTLGGGDVTLQIGGDITDVSAAVASNGRLAADSESPLVLGGGDLTVTAGGSIRGGVFAVSAGDGRLTASGAIAASTARPAPLLALDSGAFSVTAGRDAAVSGAFNPTLMPAANFTSDAQNAAYFSTLAAGSKISLLSVAGGTTLGGDTRALRTVYKPATQNWVQTHEQRWAWYPGTVEAAALSGDVSVPNAVTLLPSATGSLNLLAFGSLRISQPIQISGLDPVSFASPVRPSPNVRLLSLETGGLVPANTLLHANDPTPERLYAATGSVIGAPRQLLVSAPTPVLVKAAGDAINAGIRATHYRSSALSGVEAGGSIRFSSDFASNNASISVDGPGTLLVSAGGDIDLGSTNGIVTSGNLQNTLLPDEGASIVVGAGFGRDVAGHWRAPAIGAFIDRYVAPDFAESARYRQALVRYMGELGETGLSEAQSLAAFRALDAPEQLPFAATVLYAELRATGRAAAAAGADADYQRGYDAIATLFPGTDYSGELRMYLSQIKTQRGGDISLLVPGGLVNEGLANPPSALAKTPSQLGIVTVRGGSVNALADRDFLVNQSRVFTLAGGDILLWSSNGDIDAGKGAKTVAYAPLPTLIAKPDGTVEYDSSAAASGSGIGVLLTDPSIQPGDVDLVAPRGTVNAGDAGIRALGNLYIAALEVLGSENIVAGGEKTGVPTSETIPVQLVALQGDREAAQALDESLERLQAEAAARAARSSFTVEVIGYGP